MEGSVGHTTMYANNYLQLHTSVKSPPEHVMQEGISSMLPAQLLNYMNRHNDAAKRMHNKVTCGKVRTPC